MMPARAALPYDDQAIQNDPIASQYDSFQADRPNPNQARLSMCAVRTPSPPPYAQSPPRDHPDRLDA